MGRLKTVFHVHTDFSDDSDASVESVVASARVCGVDCIAITDHDSIDGARVLAAMAPASLRVIIGEEVSTQQGHLIGLFLSERIPAGLSVRTTAERIREQGGLVIVPHPFNRLFGCSLREYVYDIVDLIDIVEISNSQNLLPIANRQAAAFAKHHNLPGIVGVDMHHRDYLTSCFQWLPPFDDARSFVDSLSDATLMAGHHPLSYFARTARVLFGPHFGLQCPERYGKHATERRYRPEGDIAVSH